MTSASQPELPDLAAPGGDLEFLLGVLYNQQIRAETAWRAPARLRERLGSLEVVELAAADPQALTALMRIKPAIHPFATTMAASTIGLCNRLVDCHGSEAANVWADCPEAGELLSRLTGFSGIGRHKATVAITLLIREYGVQILGATALTDEALGHCPRLREVLMT